MKWFINYNKELKILYVKITGVFNINEQPQMRLDVAEASEKHSAIGILVDETETKIEVAFTDIYEMSDEKTPLKKISKKKIAVVFNKDAKNKSDFEFYENVMRNNGFNVRIFYDIDVANDWLTNDGK